MIPWADRISLWTEFEAFSLSTQNCSRVEFEVFCYQKTEVLKLKPFATRDRGVVVLSLKSVVTKDRGVAVIEFEAYHLLPETEVLQ